jgi:hypothetical protein
MTGRQATARTVGRLMFRFMVDSELRKAVRLRYSFSVMSVAPDARDKHADRSTTKAMTDQIVHCLRATDLVTSVDGGSSLLLLLVDASTPALPDIFRRIAGVLHSLPLSGGGRSTWSGGGASFPESATGSRHLIRQAQELMARARADGGNRFYVRSDRPDMRSDGRIPPLEDIV